MSILDDLKSQLPEQIDLRLLVTDMDGTLLDADGQLPARLPQVLADLRRAGVLFCPASGRQMANLRLTFGDLLQDGPVIAENGTYAVAGDVELYRLVMEPEQARGVIDTVRELTRTGMDVGAVVATPHCAYVERDDERFLAQVDTYYAARQVVGALTDLPLDDVLKVAVYDFDDAETGSSVPLAQASPDLQTVVSGQHWTDLMPLVASKGLALRAVQERLGITAAQTAVFGDYLNDLELFNESYLSFAVDNAHPRIRQAARYIAPAHTDDGVLRSAELLLSRMEP